MSFVVLVVTKFVVFKFGAFITQSSSSSCAALMVPFW